MLVRDDVNLALLYKGDVPGEVQLLNLKSADIFSITPASAPGVRMGIDPAANIRYLRKMGLIS